MYNEKDIELDIEAALKALKYGKGRTGKDGVMTPLIKQLTEGRIRGTFGL